MHVGAAKFLNRNFFACRCLDERRTTQKNSTRAAYNNVVIRKAGNIGTTGGAMAKDQRQLFYAHFGQDGLVTENSTAHVFVRKHIRLQLQETTRTVAKMDHGQAVFHGNIKGTDDLLDSQWIPCAAFDGRVVGADHNLATGDDANADNRTGRWRIAVISHVACQRRKLQKRRARIKQHLNALTWAHLALFFEPVEIALAAGMACRVLFFTELRKNASIMRIICPKFGRSR